MTTTHTQTLEQIYDCALRWTENEAPAHWGETYKHALDCLNACEGADLNDARNYPVRAVIAERDALVEQLSDEQILAGRLTLELLRSWSKIPPDVALKLKELTAQRDMLLAIVEPAIASGAITSTTEADITTALVSRSEDARKQIMREEKLRAATQALLNALGV